MFNHSLYVDVSRRYGIERKFIKGTLYATLFGFGFLAGVLSSYHEPYTLKIHQNENHIISVQLLDDEGVASFGTGGFIRAWDMRNIPGWEAKKDQTRVHAGYESYHYDIATGKVGDIAIIVEETTKELLQ